MIYVNILCHTVPFKVALLTASETPLFLSIISYCITFLVFYKGSFWLAILWPIPVRILALSLASLSTKSLCIILLKWLWLWLRLYLWLWFDSLFLSKLLLKNLIFCFQLHHFCIYLDCSWGILLSHFYYFNFYYCFIQIG